MPPQLVETKFFLPHYRAGMVARPRLEEALAARRTRLTLLSAPAGFGKTTLLSAWMAARAASAERERRVAWVSLDQADRAAENFWAYVLTAIERATDGATEGGLIALGAGMPLESVLAGVLNELSVRPDDVDIVLDDFHLADSPEIQAGLTFLLERLPPQVRLVLSTRADPALPLARLRSRGELTEIRAADLRFTDEETSRYLTDATGLHLDPADVLTLGSRTEGWIASLQLAAISLRDRSNPSAFIAGFAGDDRHIVDYLVEEVLDQQPPEIREFLLGTAILDRFTGPLCDAVMEASGSSQVLEALDRRNLFLVPLDDQRRWYRYHHLFADVLRAHLFAERPQLVPQLHGRASRWYEDLGDAQRAVGHALAANDPERAADLVELAFPALRRDRQEDVVLAWGAALPDHVVAHRPVLAIELVGGLMASNAFDGIEERLHDVSRQLLLPPDQVIVLDQDEYQRVPASVETFRAGLALVSGDHRGTIDHANRAVALCARGDDLTTSAAAALSGLASWATGDILSAHHAYTVSIAGLTRLDHIADVLGSSLALSDMELALGRLKAGERTILGALALAEQRASGSGAVVRGTADMLVALSRACWHRNDLAGAAEHLSRAEGLGESAGLPQHPYRWRVALARLRTANGDLAGALELLEEAERAYVGDFSPRVHPVHATKARVLIAMGDLLGARASADENDIRADGEVTYLREYEHLTLVRLLLAQDARQDRQVAADLLDRLLALAESESRSGSVIEIELLRTLAALSARDDKTALAALAHAVELGEPDGWVRLFVDAGPRVAQTLGVLARRTPSDFLAHLVAATSRTEQATGEERATSARAALIEPLSERELEVLRLLGSELDGPDIASELVVSLNTVRSHTQHIYTKLGVTNRRSAVSRAHQLGLLTRPSGS